MVKCRWPGLCAGGIWADNFTPMSEAAIQTTGTIIERKGEILYRVKLMNGKIVLGHLSKPLTDAKAEFPAGEEILLELTPYDFDQARILGKIL